MANSNDIIKLYMESKEILNEFESTPRDFGTGDLLYSSEIHTLVEICHNNGINLTELADNLNISKSGTSKYVKKLMDKELIVKSRAENNKKEVIFSVTQKGGTACEGHEKFKKMTFTPILEYIESIDDEGIVVLADFLINLINRINNL